MKDVSKTIKQHLNESEILEPNRNFSEGINKALDEIIYHLMYLEKHQYDETYKDFELSDYIVEIIDAFINKIPRGNKELKNTIIDAIRNY